MLLCINGKVTESECTKLSRSHKANQPLSAEAIALIGFELLASYQHQGTKLSQFAIHL